jgi:hypothetical protein
MDRIECKKDEGIRYFLMPHWADNDHHFGMLVHGADTTAVTGTLQGRAESR